VLVPCDIRLSKKFINEGSLEAVDLTQSSVNNAKVYANRVEALSHWPKGAVVAEVGVATGDFSSLILDRLMPAKFHAYDIFHLHKKDIIWGKPSGEYFGSGTHRAYYEAKFQVQIDAGTVFVFEGDSSVELAKRGEATYDVIYVDGDHRKAGVLKDTQAAVRTIKEDGLIVFNDYIKFDRKGMEYGVIQTVNSLCASGDWEMVYVALEPEGYHDVAIRRTRRAVA
jgi:hypothetical protein